MATNQAFGLEEMFRVSQRNNAAWGIEGYDVPRKYADAKKIKRNKELAALKPGKYIKAPEVYFCKKGLYLDFQYKSQTVSGNEKNKNRKFLPGPGKYHPTKKFKDELKEMAKAPKPKLDMKAVRKDEIWHIAHDAKMPDL